MRVLHLVQKPQRRGAEVFAFTLTAILMAFADLRALRSRTRAEKRMLFEQTMHEIEKEVSHAAARH